MTTKSFKNSLSGLSLLLAIFVCAMSLVSCGDSVPQSYSPKPGNNTNPGDTEYHGYKLTEIENGYNLSDTSTVEGICVEGGKEIIRTYKGKNDDQTTAIFPAEMYFPQGYIPTPKKEKIQGGWKYIYSGLQEYAVFIYYTNGDYDFSSCNGFYEYKTGWDKNTDPSYDEENRTATSEKIIDKTTYVRYIYPASITAIHAVVSAQNVTHERTPIIGFPKGKEVIWKDYENSFLTMLCGEEKFKWNYALINCNCDESEKKTLSIETKVPFTLKGEFTFSGSTTRSKGDYQTAINEDGITSSVEKLEGVYTTINDTTKAEMGTKTFTLPFMPNPTGKLVITTESKYIQTALGVVVEQETDFSKLVYSHTEINPVKTGETTKSGVTYDLYRNDVTVHGTYYGCPWSFKGDFNTEVPREGNIVPSDSIFTWKSPSFACASNGANFTVDKYVSINGATATFFKKVSILLGRTPKTGGNQSYTRETLDYTEGTFTTSTSTGNFGGYNADGIALRTDVISGSLSIGFHTFTPSFGYQIPKSKDGNLNVSVTPTITKNLDVTTSTDGKTRTFAFTSTASFKYQMGNVTEVCTDTYAETVVINLKSQEITYTHEWGADGGRACDEGWVSLYKYSSQDATRVIVRKVELNLPMYANNNYDQNAQLLDDWKNGVVSIVSSTATLGAGSWNGTTNQRKGTVKFVLDNGMIIFDTFIVTDGRGVASELPNVFGFIPTASSVEIISENASIGVSNNSLNGYDIRKGSVAYTVEVTMSDGKKCPISGTAAADGKVKENTPEYEFGYAIASVTFDRDAQYSIGSLGIYPGEGVIAHDNGVEVGHWPIDQVDLSKATTIASVNGTKTGYVPAYTETHDKVVYWFSALKGAPKVAIMSYKLNDLTAKGFFKGELIQVAKYNNLSNGIEVVIDYEKTNGNKKDWFQYKDLFPKDYSY